MVVGQTCGVRAVPIEPSTTTTIVDGNNVIGSVPDGWWRDRRGAVRRLLRRLVDYQRCTETAVVLVLDVPQPDLPAGLHDGVHVRYPTRRGRNAADDEIRQLLAELDQPQIEVVTSDRALAASAVEHQAEVTGAGRFLARLDEMGC
jgi:predicted RNA-binding protein with PIN domain